MVTPAWMLPKNVLWCTVPDDCWVNATPSSLSEKALSWTAGDDFLPVIWTPEPPLDRNVLLEISVRESRQYTAVALFWSKVLPSMRPPQSSSWRASDRQSEKVLPENVMAEPKHMAEPLTLAPNRLEARTEEEPTM
jgi:hypothetical protein